MILAAEKNERVRVNEGHAVNLGDGEKPDMKFAGDTFECPKGKADVLAKQGVVEIVKTKEETENG